MFFRLLAYFNVEVFSASDETVGDFRQGKLNIVNKQLGIFDFHHGFRSCQHDGVSLTFTCRDTSTKRVVYRMSEY